MRVLLVEDDGKISRFIARGLKREGFSVDVRSDGADAFRQMTRASYDVVLLDLVVPGMDGFEFLSKARRQGCSMPVLVVSAREDVESRVRALNGGADDYLVKPFHLAELIARLRALLRRPLEVECPVLRAADLELHLDTRKVVRGGRELDLTPREFSLLEYLLRNKGNVLSRKMIVEHVWDQHIDSVSNVIDAYVRYLRSKVDAGFEPKLIHTVRGVGYVLEEEPR